MAATTMQMKIPVEFKKKYETLSLGKLNKVKAPFPDYVRNIIENDLANLEKEVAVLKKSA